MLRRANELSGYQLGARDGSIGKVKEFYFDDLSWTIRYLVADAGNWLTGRKVLISPFALDPVRMDDNVIPVNLTRKQIENSPSLESDKPVSRQFELQYYPYYGYSPYWSGPFGSGIAAFPTREPSNLSAVTQDTNTDDPHLRSTHDVEGHSIEALDGEIGHVKDFIIDDQSWAIRYLIIDTQNWWPGKKVLISPRWIDSISWEESKVVVGLTRKAIKQCPEFNEDVLISREYEEKLHRHYNRERYWADEPIPASSVY
jgi:uncharacterized protein YrrD